MRAADAHFMAETAPATAYQYLQASFAGAACGPLCELPITSLQQAGLNQKIERQACLIFCSQRRVGPQHKLLQRLQKLCEVARTQAGAQGPCVVCLLCLTPVANESCMK